MFNIRGVGFGQVVMLHPIDDQMYGGGGFFDSGGRGIVTAQIGKERQRIQQTRLDATEQQTQCGKVHTGVGSDKNRSVLP